MEFKERLRDLRKKSGMTQKQLAVRANVSREAIGNYETGERTAPPIDIVNRLADALGVSVDFLLGKSNNRVAQLRQEKGLSQQELEDKLGIALDEVIGIETGKKPLSTRVALELRSILGAGPRDLLSDSAAKELAAQFNELKTLVNSEGFKESSERMRQLEPLLVAQENYLKELSNQGFTPNDYSRSISLIETAQLGKTVVLFLESAAAIRKEMSGPVLEFPTPSTEDDSE